MCLNKIYGLLLFVVCVLYQYHLVQTEQRNDAQQQLLIMLPDQTGLVQFFYIPTNKGYRYGYMLSNGVQRQEYGIIPAAELAIANGDCNINDNNNYNVNTVAGGSQGLGEDLPARPDNLMKLIAGMDLNEFRRRAKNRKLSPKSLQSLAG